MARGYKNIPNILRLHYNHYDDITIEDGLIFNGKALIIPLVESEKILQKISEGYQYIIIKY